MIRFASGVIALLLILCVVDYATPYNVPIIMDNNPLDTDYLDMIKGSFMEESNVISMPNNNLDFEYGTIGWHLHYMYSVPPDYWETTFEDSKSGHQSLRLAHTCDSSTFETVQGEQTKTCLFRTDKLQPFNSNVYVKFYVKSLRLHENAFWDNNFGNRFTTVTTYSLNVEAMDEWGERIYTKDIVDELYRYQNSQLVKVVEYDFSGNASAQDYFEKINAIDYNATHHGSLDQIQAMIDMQNSLVQGGVLYYVTNTNELPKSSYAVYLGNGWYTIIMPVPKETRYLGFNSQVYCTGQREFWSYSWAGDTFHPTVPSKADTLTYIDGITFIKTISTQDITAPTSTTPTSSSADWTDDIDNTNTNNANGTTSTGNNWLGLILFLGIVAVFVYLAFFNKGGKGKGKGSFLGKAVKTPKLRSEPKQKPILVKEHYRKQKNSGGLL